MHFKKLIGIISCLALLSAMTFGCGSVNNEEKEADSGAEEQVSVAEEETEEVLEDSSDDISLEADIIGSITMAKDDEETQKVFDELERINKDEYVIMTNLYGYITFLNGSITEEPALGEEDYKKIMDKLSPAVSIDNDINLQMTYTLTDDYDDTIAVFQEVLDGEINESNVVKLIFDKDGNMKGATSTIIPYADSGEKTIDGATALEIVKKNLKENSPGVNYMIYTNEPKLNYRHQTDYITGKEYYSKVYVILTDNPEANVSTSDTPYLEQIVSRNGTYLGAYPANVSLEADNERDFDIIQKWLKRDETVSYTTEIEFPDGRKEKVTVPVAYDDGKYFLEDAKRNIICADYWEFEFNKQIKVISSETNDDWDPDYVIAYHNYITSYDAYADTGWYGPEGNHEPMVLLMDYCDEKHEPVDNVCYLGELEGVHLFTANSKGSEYHKALDIIAHEYTHSVTTSAMGTVMYKNESGAINESMSDIMGELVEMMYCMATQNALDEKTIFMIGNDSGVPFRDMFVPNSLGQPEKLGGPFYAPPAAIPSEINDLGGVHMNSSILGKIFYNMYERTSFDLRELWSIWTTTICLMVPGTEFVEMTEIIPLACELCGFDGELDKVSECIEDVINLDEEPFSNIDEGNSLIRISLPPWIDWSRTRVDAYDEWGYVYHSWPSRGTNEVKMTLFEGKYTFFLSEFDKKGKQINCWEYNGKSWNKSDGVDNFIEIEGDRNYSLSSFSTE